MPGLTGLELIRKIHEIAPQTEFIILSGYGEFEFAKEAMQYGVQHYLLKPCTTEQIIDSVVKARDTHLNKLSKENKANYLMNVCENDQLIAIYLLPLIYNYPKKIYILFILILGNTLEI